MRGLPDSGKRNLGTVHKTGKNCVRCSIRYSWSLHQAGAFHRSGETWAAHAVLAEEAGAAYIALRGSISYGTMITVMQRMGRTMSEENYTYILSARTEPYCGWTNHLKERVAAHNAEKAPNTQKPQARGVEVLRNLQHEAGGHAAGMGGQAVKPKEKLALIGQFQKQQMPETQ